MQCPVARFFEYLHWIRCQSRRRLAQDDESRVRDVNRAHCCIMTGARLADQQNGSVRAQKLFDRALGLDDRGAGAERRERDAAWTLTGSRLQRPRHRREQLLQANGLFEKIERADLRGFDCGFNGPVSRHHDDRHGQLPVRRPFAQQRHAIGIRHPDIEQHQ